jgi:ribosomal protein S6--L-glutamate ligase
VQPVPRRPGVAITCEAPLVGVRDVISSNGERERRYVVRTRLAIADESWPVEITLTDRAQMRTRMLIGRQAIAGRGLIDPARSFLQPRLSWRSYRERD